AHAIPNQTAEGHPGTAHLFIINPLSGMAMDNLFSTHPATENRIAALDQLAREMGQGGFHDGYQSGTGGTATASRSPTAPASGPWGRGSTSVPRAGGRGPWG